MAGLPSNNSHYRGLARARLQEGRSRKGRIGWLPEFDQSTKAALSFDDLYSLPCGNTLKRLTQTAWPMNLHLIAVFFAAEAEVKHTRVQAGEAFRAGHPLDAPELA